MQVTATSSVADTATQSQSNAFSALDGQAFLRLLVAQMQNQDPLNPMDNQEFMSQLTQLSSLEKLTSINQTMQSSLTAGELGLASSLLGRGIEWTDDSGMVRGGPVTEVRHSAGGCRLLVGDTLVALGQVTRIAATVAEPAAIATE